MIGVMVKRHMDSKKARGPVMSFSSTSKYVEEDIMGNSNRTSVHNALFRKSFT
jgi:hypothetical protein